MDMKVKLPGGIPAVPETVRQYNSPGLSYASALAKTSQSAQRFDRFTSSVDTGRSSFEMELRGKLNQEVRTATSSGMVASLREQVLAGQYQPDPLEIARKMLLLPGEDA